MGKRTPIILLRSVNVNRGGVTQSVIKRANVLAETYKEVIIITLNFQREFQKIVKRLHRQKVLLKNVTVLNFFDSMRTEPSKKLFKRKQIHTIKEKDYYEFHMPNHTGQSYRYYKDGFYEKYKRFNEKGVIQFIDYRDHALQRTKREEFNDQGELVRVRHMDPALDKPRFDQYFDQNGECFLSVNVNPTTQKDGYTVHFKDKPTAYNQMSDLIKQWLQRTVNKIKYPVIMCEQRGLDHLVIDINHPTIKKVAVAHSTHLTKPHDDINEIDPPYKRLFRWKDRFDNIVVLTKEQKQDIEAIYGEQDHVLVIPHACQRATNSIKHEKIKPNNRLVISIARYVKDKRIDESIRAFEHVVDRVPDAQLHIYGGGPLEQELQKLIKKLKLENNVYLKGYTLNPEKKYKMAACSILTSIREGFGMVITESLSKGTPVISYGIKYGPKDIIKDGINGFLVENGNQKELADKIVQLMKDDKLRERLSNNAPSVKREFSEKRYKRNWNNVIKTTNQ